MRVERVLIPVVGLLCLAPVMPAAGALIAGVLIAVFLSNPYPTKNYTHRLLTFSVMGLGAGMNLKTVASVGLQGIGYTVVSILTVLLLGWILQRVMKVEEEAGILISVGTAICGGSAIAAVTPVIRAKPQAVSVALGTVFILNAVALVLFPLLGHALQMDERSFGLWSALAIHDTSSVVGATLSYGKVAAEVGTTVKLARALWIVPVTLMVGFVKRSSGSGSSAKKPWFILGFILAAALVTWVPELQPLGHWVEKISKRALVLTLFFIGLGLSKETLKQVGFKPFFMGVALWLMIGLGSLAAILMGWIR